MRTKYFRARKKTQLTLVPQVKNVDTAVTVVAIEVTRVVAPLSSPDTETERGNTHKQTQLMIAVFNAAYRRKNSSFSTTAVHCMFILLSLETQIHATPAQLQWSRLSLRVPIHRQHPATKTAEGVPSFFFFLFLSPYP